MPVIKIYYVFYPGINEMDVPMCSYWGKRFFWNLKPISAPLYSYVQQAGQTSTSPGLQVVTLGSNSALLLTSCVPSDKTPCY